MPRRKFMLTIHTPDGPAPTEATRAGWTVAVHRPFRSDGLPPRGWTVTHVRTGLVACDRYGTKPEAFAFAAGFDRVVCHFGDAGQLGDGTDLDSGARSRAMRAFFLATAREPDELLTGSRLRPVPLTRSRALALADEALRSAEPEPTTA